MLIVSTELICLLIVPLVLLLLLISCIVTKILLLDTCIKIACKRIISSGLLLRHGSPIMLLGSICHTLCLASIWIRLESCFGLFCKWILRLSYLSVLVKYNCSKNIACILLFTLIWNSIHKIKVIIGLLLWRIAGITYVKV